MIKEKTKGKVILDSISPDGIRLLTHEVTCHRWILAEINTHRQLSRNYRSSRAVPTAKLLKEVRTDPAAPVVWLKNRPGMQATEPMTAYEEIQARLEWEHAAGEAADAVERLSRTNLHKQWANRLLEPFLYVHGVISSTEWANFYTRRRALDAQPEFKALADAMWEAKEGSVPKLLKPGEWHLPYFDPAVDVNLFPAPPGDWPMAKGNQYKESSWFLSCAKKVSVARVARVSIKPFDERERNVEKDLALHDQLWLNNHPSPFEHQATPDYVNRGGESGRWQRPDLHGNFSGWVQYRKQLPNECVPDR